MCPFDKKNGTILPETRNLLEQSLQSNLAPRPVFIEYLSLPSEWKDSPWTVRTRWTKVARIDERRVGLHVERTLRAHRRHRHVAVVQAQP